MDPMPRLIAVIVATLVVHAGVFGGFHFYEQRLKQARARATLAQQGKWHNEDQQRERDQKQAVDAKFGNNAVDRVVNDPAVDILGLLKVLAGQDLPKTAQVTVGVERFTEFSIYLKTISALPSEQRVAYLRKVLSRINPAYVFQVAFVEEDGPTMAAEQSCLLQIKDWARASDAAIARACF